LVDNPDNVDRRSNAQGHKLNNEQAGRKKQERKEEDAHTHKKTKQKKVTNLKFQQMISTTWCLSRISNQTPASQKKTNNANNS
jgi:transposase